MLWFLPEEIRTILLVALFVRQWIKLKNVVSSGWSTLPPRPQYHEFVRRGHPLQVGFTKGKTRQSHDAKRTMILVELFGWVLVMFFWGGFLSSCWHQSLNMAVQCNLKIRHISTFPVKPSDPGLAEHSLWAAMPENNDMLSSQTVLATKPLVLH